MYAYKQQNTARVIYTTPQRRVTKPAVIRKKPVIKKKKNSIIEFLRMSVCLSFLAIFVVFVFPSAYHSLIQQVFMPKMVPTSIKFENSMKFKNPAYSTTVDLHKMAFPVTNYVHNDMFNNQLLLTPTLQKMHSEVTTMYHTSEMHGLKKELYNLMLNYSLIKPSIYVWEYEQGRYVDIKADELYPAASIIKIPVLVRLFKSIEANQLTIYDEMKMTEQYRSSGSGSLQYSQAGREYSMDYLAKIMIQESDNTSTNMIMSKLGGMDDINTGLRDWGMSKTYLRTWLPDLNGTNKTTALEMAKLLYNLDNPGFLNINSREYIIDYMSHVKNDRLIKAGLGEGAIFVHKTGDIGTMLGDAGIVYAPNGKKYIVVILAKRPHNSYQGKEFIVKASELIYKAIVG